MSKRGDNEHVPTSWTAREVRSQAHSEIVECCLDEDVEKGPIARAIRRIANEIANEIANAKMSGHAERLRVCATALRNTPPPNGPYLAVAQSFEILADGLLTGRGEDS
jgi:hypothetical protein